MTVLRADVPELLVLRHGETEWNRAGRLQGALDSPLTARGRQQAGHQGTILQTVADVAGYTWVSSPQGRAKQTALLARGAVQVDVATDDRLREIGMGEWTGACRDDLAAARPDLFSGRFLEWYDQAPGGEGLAALADRVASFLLDLSGPTVIVTHGITSRVIRCLATGRPHTDFGRVEGGQGIVYRVADRSSVKLT